MDKVAEYRKCIIKELLHRKDGEGRSLLTPAEAETLAAALSDEDLAFGMDYNTPDEVADLLLEWD